MYMCVSVCLYSKYLFICKYIYVIQEIYIYIYYIYIYIYIQGDGKIKCQSSGPPPYLGIPH